MSVQTIKLTGFHRKGAEKSTISVKIDAEVVQSLEDTEKRLEQMIAAKLVGDLSISRPTIVESAIRDFVAKANAELDRIEKAGKSSNDRPSGGSRASQKQSDPAATPAS